MQNIVRGLLALVLAGASAAPLTAQEATPLQVKLSGYAQIQFNTTNFDEARVASSTFETRRVRIYADIVMGDWISGRIQPEWAMGNFQLADVFMNFAVDPRFQVRVGQFKRPFNLIFLNSSTQDLIVERGFRVRGFDNSLNGGAALPYTQVNGKYIHGEGYAVLNTMGLMGRDMGVAAHGRLGRAGYELALFNGSGSDKPDDNNGKSVMARMTFTPVTGLPLALGASASYREVYFNGTVDGQTISGRDLTGKAFGLDMEWGGFRARGVHLMAEVAIGDNLYHDNRFLGTQGVITYLQPLAGARVEAIEFAGRLSYGDPDTARSGDQGVLLTPGINLYFNDRNRLMLNWDTYRPGASGVRAANAVRVQTQFFFGTTVAPPAPVAAVSSKE